jgi:hypothetical protein
MSEYKVKLLAALPKGDGNGFDDYTLVGQLVGDRREGHGSPPRVALLVYGTKDVILGKDGVDTARLEVLRVEPVHTEPGRRLAEQMLADEFAARTGQAMLPYDLAALSKAAFADLPRSVAEIDEGEERERDSMSPTDELRRHLERVHGAESAHLFTAEEAEAVHRADHDGDVLGPLAHDRDWFGWTRADLEAAESESEDDGTPTNEDLEGPDPDLGKDLDVEDDQVDEDHDEREGNVTPLFAAGPF